MVELTTRPTTTTRISPPSRTTKARSARFWLHRKKSLRSLNLKGSCRLQQSSYEFHAESMKNWNAKWNGICTGHVWCTSSYHYYYYYYHVHVFLLGLRDSAGSSRQAPGGVSAPLQKVALRCLERPLSLESPGHQGMRKVFLHMSFTHGTGISRFFQPREGWMG